MNATLFSISIFTTLLSILFLPLCALIITMF